MKPYWLYLSIAGLAFTLSGCSHTREPAKEVPQAACIVSTGLPNNAMGRLGIQIIQIGNNVRVVIPSDTVFRGRSVEIKPSAYDGLDSLASFIAKYPNRRMMVKGYTDNLGSYANDQALSEGQAQSIITYLWTQGVPHECLTAVGIGKNSTQTVATNRSINGKTANRRVEITFRAD